MDTTNGGPGTTTDFFLTTTTKKARHVVSTSKLCFRGSSPKRQTGRKSGAQSYGSLRDRQATEALLNTRHRHGSGQLVHVGQKGSWDRVGTSGYVEVRFGSVPKTET